MDLGGPVDDFRALYKLIWVAGIADIDHFGRFQGDTVHQ